MMVLGRPVPGRDVLRDGRSAQLSAVMHAPEFQKLERSWTGLHYLVKNSATGQNIKIKMLNATKKELVKNFQSALEFDQSAIFKKVYEEEFGTFGGAPYGTLIGDFEITRQPEDMYFVEQMSHVAAAAHAPFISAASPELFGLHDAVIGAGYTPVRAVIDRAADILERIGMEVDRVSHDIFEPEDLPVRSRSRHRAKPKNASGSRKAASAEPMWIEPNTSPVFTTRLSSRTARGTCFSAT